MLLGPNEFDHDRDELILSTLAEVAFLPVWIEGLASRHGIPVAVHLPTNLCLEEAVTNVIRHGYRTTPGKPVTVRFTAPRGGEFVLFVEDQAPHFDPLAAPELPSIGAHDAPHVGGQGIRLMRRFSESLSYEPTPTGNRLRLGFSNAQASESRSPR